MCIDNLPAVGSLGVSGLNISWEAPFSLRDDPITYCIAVMSSSPFHVLFSQCGINNTQLTIPSPPPQDIACKTYEITVIPVNSQGNGTTTSIHGSFLLNGTHSSINRSHAVIPEVENFLLLDPGTDPCYCSSLFFYELILVHNELAITIIYVIFYSLFQCVMSVLH